jgi:hypothetical protein
MLDATPLKPGESYGTVADIRDCPDLPEMPITPGARYQDGTFDPYWTRSDGSPIAVLVRAPSLAARREIEQAAADKDDMQFVLETCFHCIVAPTFTREQLKDVLSTKNPAALIQISDTAWQLADFPSTLIDREVRRLTGLAAEPTPPAPKPVRQRAPKKSTA